MSRQPYILDKKWTKLEEANIELGRAISGAKIYFEIAKIIQLNTESIEKVGAPRFFFRSMHVLCLEKVVLCIENIFERNKGNVCSVTNIRDIAIELNPKNKNALDNFAQIYGITPTLDWKKDLEGVFCKLRPSFKANLKMTSKIRNQRLAHLTRDAFGDGTRQFPYHQIPSFDELEKILEFAIAFHKVIGKGFGVPALDEIDGKTRNSLITTLQKLGVSDLKIDFAK